MMSAIVSRCRRTAAARPRPWAAWGTRALRPIARAGAADGEQEQETRPQARVRAPGPDRDADVDEAVDDGEVRRHQPGARTDEAGEIGRGDIHAPGTGDVHHKDRLVGEPPEGRGKHAVDLPLERAVAVLLVLVEQVHRAIMTAQREVTAMLTAFIRAALQRARYETMEDGFIYGEIPEIQGVYANASTLEACRDTVQSAAYPETSGHCSFGMGSDREHNCSLQTATPGC